MVVSFLNTPVFIQLNLCSSSMILFYSVVTINLLYNQSLTLPFVAWEHCVFIIFLFASHIFSLSLSLSLVLTSQILNVVPILLRIPGVPQKVFRGQKEFMDFVDVLIDKHMETWNPAYTRDFTDAFLKEMKKVRWHQQNRRVWGQFLCLLKLVNRSWLSS